ncbi:alkylglycerol monooxygenase-like [Ruditapes philippinarum]|uniref:alkylglycerol monooxygenase-like n=1 Tax=Ruditapes philippinarum TaxID=129788 RepID=UPI00295BE19D|nr:alkylglycerol monooxygenase-like [Ruditapes philippinarum]
MSNLNKVDFVTGMRRLFYVVSPNETTFRTPEEVPKYINEATPFFFVFMAIETVISILKQDKKVRMNDAFTSLSAGMFSRLPLLITRSITIAGYSWVYDHYCIKELPWESPWVWWFTFLGVDMAYYWFHRFAHEVNIMWSFHQTHHSSEDYNFSTALRQSWLQVYTSWVFYLPMALFVPPAVFLAHQELNILYQFWIHTQYVKSLGPLEYIFNTPSHHRVHHGRNPYCIDKNYAGTLIIWDRLFGTFAAESEEVAYGLTHPLNSFEPFTVQFGYLKYLLGRALDMKGVTNWVKNFLYGPGWLPGKPRTGDINDIPKIEKPVKRYSVQLPQWKSVYVFIHFLLFSIAYQELMARRATLSQTSVLIFLVYCFYNLTCFGRLFDDRFEFSI